MLRTVSIAGIFVVALAHLAAAADDDLATCKSSSNESNAISACTRIISARKLQGKDLNRVYYERGLKRRYNHDYNGAISDFTAAIKLDSKDTWAHVARGHAYAYKKDFPRAFADQEIAIGLDTSAVTYTGRALDLIEAGAYDRAIADLNEALRLNPKYFYGYLYRGNAYLKKGEFAKAEADYRKAAEIKPNDKDASDGLKNARDRVVR